MWLQIVRCSLNSEILVPALWDPRGLCQASHLSSRIDERVSLVLILYSYRRIHFLSPQRKMLHFNWNKRNSPSFWATKRSISNEHNYFSFSPWSCMCRCGQARTYMWLFTHTCKYALVCMYSGSQCIHTHAHTYAGCEFTLACICSKFTCVHVLRAV